METTTDKKFVATRNACKVCTPLGASLAFKGVEGCMPLIHGSQGCATYIRRYLISHYKEPMDIASTNFTEHSAVYGGKQNLYTALDNIINQYNPSVIGIASTCLSETIGDDLQQLIAGYKKSRGTEVPDLIFASTPSYQGTHMNGFHEAVLSIAKHYASPQTAIEQVNLFPGFVSPGDLRLLKELMDDYQMPYVMLPDYSDTLDGVHTKAYTKVPEGGTPVAALKTIGGSKASIEMGYITNQQSVHKEPETAARHLERVYSIPRYSVGIPIGIKETDRLFDALGCLSGKPMPEKYARQRGRLVDAYVDGHKYVFGKRAIVYGEEDFVLGMVSFLEEIGIETVLCASGAQSGLLEKKIMEHVCPCKPIAVRDSFDFEEIAEYAKELAPDIIIGNSKGYYIARELSIPIVRVGFPIHDRLGGQRQQHILYEGTHQLFDQVANALIQYKQDSSPVGYKYM